MVWPTAVPGNRWHMSIIEHHRPQADAGPSLSRLWRAREAIGAFVDSPDAPAFERVVGEVGGLLAGDVDPPAGSAAAGSSDPEGGLVESFNRFAWSLPGTAGSVAAALELRHLVLERMDRESSTIRSPAPGGPVAPGG